MDEQEKQALAESLQLARENNQMLHAMRRQAHWAQAWGTVKLLVIIASLVWSFYYVRPYLDQIARLYQQTQQLQSSSGNVLDNLLKNFQASPTSSKKTVQ